MTRIQERAVQNYEQSLQQAFADAVTYQSGNEADLMKRSAVVPAKGQKIPDGAHINSKTGEIVLRSEINRGANKALILSAATVLTVFAAPYLITEFVRGFPNIKPEDFKFHPTR